MASMVAVCISFYRTIPFQASEEIASERKNSTRLAFNRFSSYRASRPGNKLHISSHSDTGSFTASSGRDHLTASSRHCCVTISELLDPMFSNSVVLYGYWVGPDIEDGWGYIEAFVSQTF
ncbi:uncharacterized protein LOC122091225 [Macadamia integrifolia]|uniref:uncharacterized protein LOC122091225 n=1 Tax=Macadamia integrifolia TaxID=60698 RepID=UPI001C4E882D|nr:uncharacterized protein LOC122091225 [Macadamia integrifolia]